MKVSIVLLAVVAFAAAAPSSYDYKPAYKEHYDYVRLTCHLQFKYQSVISTQHVVMSLRL